ncbi:MAG: TonB-dependent receptor [Sulfuricellaceae bacterium]
MSGYAKNYAAIFLLSLAGCWSTAHGADDGDVQSLLPLSLDELFATKVVTASRHQENRTDSPAHIVVFTREQIRERRYKNLADLLEDLPGVDIQRGTRSSVYNNFTFQGHVNNNKMLIMLNGVRIDHPVGGKIPVAENFALYNAKQVEVLYGSAAALYGADAAAGVINIITDHAADAEGAWVSAGGGSFGETEASLLAGVKLNDWMALTVGGHKQSSDRARLDQYYLKDFPKVDAKTFSGSVAVPSVARENYTGGTAGDSLYARLDAGDDLTLGYYRNYFRSLTSTGDRPDTTLYLDNARWDTAIETMYGTLRFNLTPNLKGELVVDYSGYEVDPASKYLNIYTDFQDNGYVYDKAWRRGVEQNFNWRVNDANTVLAGVGYKDYYALITPDLPKPYNTSLSPDAQGLAYPNTTLPIPVFEAHYSNTSAYFQLQSEWNKAVSTMIGARYDQHSAYGASVNPRLGMVWHNAPDSHIKLLYGEAFRAPAPEDGFSTFGTFGGAKNSNGLYLGNNFRSPNFDLKPETSRNLSAAWDWRPRSNLNFIANAYYSEVDNLIVTSSEAVPTQYIPGALLSQSTIKVNAGKEMHQGIDLILNWRNQFGNAWSSDTWGGYSYETGHIKESQNALTLAQSYIPEQKLKLGNTFRYRDRYTITPKLYLIGATTTERNDKTQPGERLKTPGYALMNLHFGAHKLADRNLSAYLDIYNLFDRRYYVAAGSSSTTFVNMPQPPRSAMLTLEYRF